MKLRMINMDSKFLFLCRVPGGGGAIYSQKEHIEGETHFFCLGHADL